jgi:hypothetical protein
MSRASDSMCVTRVKSGVVGGKAFNTKFCFYSAIIDLGIQILVNTQANKHC